MHSLVPRPQLQVQKSGKLFVKGDIAQGTSDRHQHFCLLNVTRQLNKMFPPRGKLLLSQLILLATRLPIIQVQVCSPETRFKGFLIYFLVVVGRGVHSPVRSGFNIKIQPNRKIPFLVNITPTEPRTGSNRTGFVRFGSVF